ncbi:MAG: hypothetical protein ACFB51_17835 [Anaerolineae bacterium]
MSHTIYQMDELPVLVFEGHEDYDTTTEMESVMGRIMGTLEGLSSPVYHIVDLSRVPPFDFDDTLNGANAAALGPNPILHHPMIKKVIYVTDDEFMKIALKGMDSEMFGHVKVMMVDTLDDALAFIRGDKAS